MDLQLSYNMFQLNDGVNEYMGLWIFFRTEELSAIPVQRKEKIWQAEKEEG